MLKLMYLVVLLNVLVPYQKLSNDVEDRRHETKFYNAAVEQIQSANYEFHVYVLKSK